MARHVAARAKPHTAFRLHHPRLTTSLLVGVGLFAALDAFTSLSWRMCFIVAWDVATACAFVLLYAGLHGANAATMKQNAVREDAGKWVVLAVTLVAATASLVVIASTMPQVKESAGLEKAGGVLLVVYTVVASWAMIQTMGALHYAHDYYFDADVSGKAMHDPARLVFPGGAPPTYGDFLYFSFTIGMTFQVSDVQIADRGIRRIVLAHSIAAFFYTTGILALAINLVAGLI